jgi:hypothetical protein
MTVYFLETQYQYREWNDLFLELVLHLKENNGAKIIHQKGGFLPVDFLGIELSDCHLLIHDEESDRLRGISFQDIPMQFTDAFIRRNKPGDILILSQQVNKFPQNFDGSHFNFKLDQGTWYPSMSFTNYDFFYHQRQFYNENLIDKMFYLGASYRHDVKRMVDMGICNQDNSNLTHSQYLFESIKYKLGFSAAGIGEVCYRDFEYLATGVPMIRLEYMTTLNPPLIPNFHYVSVDRKDFPWGTTADRDGGVEYAEAYRKRFLEVKDDKEFLDFISKNGREYYMKYSHPTTRLKHVLNILEL